MSNDTPPRACLADFGFTTMTLDPTMSCSVKSEGGAVTFMSPEILAPSRFGLKDSVPMQEADVYAFGLVIYQVWEQDRGYPPFTYIAQVLTGETPFRGLRLGEIALSVVQGERPAKPENASAIGFSDSLWNFVQCCWDGKMESRPEVAEVVSRLERAAVDWDGVMPPCVHEGAIPEEPLSDSMEYRKLGISIPP
jgi:hypothetical protein